MPLAGKKILVTRPQGQADKLISAIEQAGGQAYHYPVLAIEPLQVGSEPEHVQLSKQRVMDLDHYQHIIFISTNAAHYGMRWINDYWPQLPLGLRWYAIGSSTAKVLIQAGVNVSVNATPTGVCTMDSEALLLHPDLQQVDGEKILIVRGVGGRELLKAQLEQRGARVYYLECYKRTLPEHPAGDLDKVLADAPDVICVNSADSFENLCRLAGQSRLATLQSIQLLLPSQRVARIAAQRGFKHLSVAENASDNAMMRGLKRLADVDK